MDEAVGKGEYYYAGFISYASTSRDLAARLHRELERYTVPKSLRDRRSGLGSSGRTVGKFFMDNEELSASTRLRGDLFDALDRSKRLIVLCSPDAARSDWVREEIAYFITKGRSADVILVLADGDPKFYHPELAPKGAFPPALEAKTGETSDLPLAPDIRYAVDSFSRQGEGFETGLLRIVAAVLGVSYPDLTQRHLVAERQKRRKRNQIIGALSVLLVAAVLAGVVAWLQKQSAELRLAQAIGSAARQVHLATGMRDRYGVPSAVPSELFSGARSDFELILNDAGTTPDLLLERARFRLGMAELSSDISGSDGSALSFVQEASEDIARARRISQRWFAQLLYGKLPESDKFLREEVNSIRLLARISARQKNVNQAEALGRRAETLTQQLSRSTTETAATVSSHCDLADILYQLDQRLRAEVAYESCLAKAHMLWARQQNTTAQVILTRALIDYGMIVRLHPTRMAEAEALHVRAVDLTKDLASDWQSNDARLLAADARLTLGDTLTRAGRPSKLILTNYETVREILQNLLDVDSSRNDWIILSAQVLYRISALRATEYIHASSIEGLRSEAASVGAEAEIIARLARRFPDDIAIERTWTALLETRAEINANICMRNRQADRSACKFAQSDMDGVVEKRLHRARLHTQQPVLRRDLAQAYATRARLGLMLDASIDEVRKDLEAARAIFESLRAIPDFESEIPRDLALTDRTEAQALSAAGRGQEACSVATRAHSTLVASYVGDKNIEKMQKDSENSRIFVTELCN